LETRNHWSQIRSSRGSLPVLGTPGKALEPGGLEHCHDRGVHLTPHVAGDAAYRSVADQGIRWASHESCRSIERVVHLAQTDLVSAYPLYAARALLARPAVRSEVRRCSRHFVETCCRSASSLTLINPLLQFGARCNMGLAPQRVLVPSCVVLPYSRRTTSDYSGLRTAVKPSRTGLVRL